MTDILGIQNGSIFEKGYGLLAKKVMQDQELTIEAKAIYSYLVTFAGNGQTAFPGVSKITYDLGISKDRFYNHMDKLLKAGYINKSQERAKGKFAKNVYTIIHYVKPDTVGNSPCPDSPDTDEPNTGIPRTAVQDTNSNKINNNKVKSIKPNNNVHQDEPEFKLIRTGNQYKYPEQFESMWENYPRRKSKKACYRKWKSTLKNNDVDNLTLIRCVKMYNQECAGKKDKYIKLGSTFFGPDEHWRDYLNVTSIDEKKEERKKNIINNQMKYLRGRES